MTRLARSLGVRPGEGRLAGLVAAIFATVEAARGFGEVAADALVIGRLGPSTLPWLFIGLGATSLVAALAYTAALGRARRGPLFAAILAALGGAILLVELALIGGAGSVQLTWLTVYVAGAIVGTLVWALAGSVFDMRQAKRLFPVCTSAAILGGFAGTLAAGPAAALVGTEWVVALEAVGLAAAAVLVGRLVAEHAAPRLVTKPPRRPLAAELRAGLDFVAGSPLMRLVAIAYVLFSVLAFSVTAPFFRAMSEAFPPGASAELTTVIGLLSAGVTATSFVLSLVVAPRLYARFGVATAALILPLVYLAGFGLWIVAFTPATAALVRFGQQATQRGLSNAAWSAFYNVVPASRRPQVLAFNDGVPGQLGIVLSGVLILTVETILAPEQVPWLGAGTALVCAAVVIAIRRRYADSLVRALRSGLGEQVLGGGPGLVALAADSRSTTALVRALEASEPGVRAMAAELLGRLDARDAASAVASRMTDEDPTVRAAAIAATAKLDGPLARDRLQAGFADAAPIVRAAAVETAARLDPGSVVAVVDRLSADPDPGVRGALAVGLAQGGDHARAAAIVDALVTAADADSRAAGLRAIGRSDGSSGERARLQSLVAALDDDSRVVRRVAAEALREVDASAPPDGVLDRLANGTPRSQEAALWALDGHGEAVREPLLRWATGQVDRATALRANVRALDRLPADSPCVGFLSDLLFRRQDEILRRLLLGLAVLGAPDAGGLIRRCLRSNDPDVRSQAVEALDSLGDPALRRAIVSLLEPPDEAPVRDPAAVLAQLGEDDDPWIRALALRARAERAAVDWSTIRERTRKDPHPAVRAALDGLGEAGDRPPPMPEQARTLSEIDRMLFLRRVPLFAELVPEDLQRIAATADERVFGPDEVVVREEELGEELVVIIDGAVRVVHLQPDGSEQRLRGYGAGDHFGELAVLREAARAATVIAEPPGVRGLVIGGDGLKAILRERPEAAMAMLATLATRISEQ